MDTKDILLFESGDGGEMAISGNDLVLVETILQQAYLALFGGNVEANTIGDEIPTQERLDYWANELLWKEKPNKQFNSNTERVLTETVLNSSGRIAITNAVELDLDYLKILVNFEVAISILSTNKVEISISMQKKDNLESKVLILIYDNAKNEVITNKII
ncbi:hypothetical protein [Tenacibaculum finnmarkense]|uniref:hypothetical protein n=1 Tax=Tenacibaculum finnmarkense TaxID=2781243 RepID=UPI0020797FA7|nr:hypothetical protein [Tenacibaculum finnmarkense]MCM8906778.1 hypothetical protein [Tenacibaculum finnmarkense genomovar finnmarkense]